MTVPEGVPGDGRVTHALESYPCFAAASEGAPGDLQGRILYGLSPDVGPGVAASDIVNGDGGALSVPHDKYAPCDTIDLHIADSQIAWAIPRPARTARHDVDSH